MIDRDEFNRNKYEYDEFRDSLPNELRELLDNVYELLNPFVNIITPTKKDLHEPLTGFVKKQFPELNITGKDYLTECINDVVLFASEGLSTDIYKELLRIHEKIPYDDVEKFESHVRTFARPETPRLITIEFYDRFSELTKEEKEGYVKEENDEAIAVCEEINALKTAFLETINPILFTHFDKQFDELDSEGWDRIGIVIGLAYNIYIQDCYSLCHYFENGWLDEHPGMNFFQYKIKKIEERQTKVEV